MRRNIGARKTLGLLAVVAAVAFAILSGSRTVRAGQDENGDQNEESLIQRGFDTAPVPLNLHGRNRALVGLGSYIVNVVGDCNGCHSAGPATEFAPGGNPYFRSPIFTGTKVTNLATYLGGGRDFGPVGSVPHLYSRNLTPDNTGLPEGGRTYEQFVEIMRTGADLDHIHPNCTAAGTPANCFLPPFNGDLLQVMRWPSFQNMTDHQLRAIYEYLSAVPCNPGPGIASAPYLQNTCE
ncbi:MAG TPA: hypothetical protein VH350_09465 [Candidatus Sulfotelmatobacter sp.]|jgi:hypothetical protein|nr:hypothetical protein [Candidatus Sulfotelmatobacter sp.]